MKKLMLIMILGILLLSVASATIKSYDLDKRELTVSNEGLLGTKTTSIITAKLNTPDLFVRPIGYQYVWEIEINSYEEIKSFMTMELYNKKDMKGITRTLDYKYKVEQYQEVEDYILKCTDVKTLKNGTIIQECETVKGKSTYEWKEAWVTLEKLDLLKGQTITIRAYTHVLEEDYVEWIPTIAGKRVPEWAGWQASYDVDVISWWNMSQASGTILDWFGNHDSSSETAIAYGASGIVPNGINLTGTTGRIAYGINADLQGKVARSMGCWYQNDKGADDYVIGTFSRNAGNEYDGESIWVVSSDLGYRSGIGGTGGGGRMEANSGVNITDGVFHHIVLVCNVLACELWNDGLNVLNWSNAQLPSVDATYSTFDIGGANFASGWDGNPAGDYDECFYYNRTLSTAEIQAFYNSGSGISPEPAAADQPPVVNLNAPANSTVYEVSSIDFSCTASDDINLANVTLVYDGANETANTTGLNNSIYYFNVAGVTEGIHTWTCAGEDNETQRTIPAARHINLTYPTPIITSISPIADYNSTSRTLGFGANIALSANSTLANVTLFIDGLLIETNSSGTLGVYNFSTTVTEAAHNFSIKAESNVSKEGNSAAQDFNITLASPAVTLQGPTNATNFTVSTVNVYCVVTDDKKVDNVTFILNGADESTNTSGLNNSNYTYAFTSLTNGEYNWTCRGEDNDTKTTTATAKTFNVSLPPTLLVQLNTPSDASTSINNPVIFYGNLSNDVGIANVTLWTNKSGWTAKNTTYQIGASQQVFSNTTKGGIDNTISLVSTIARGGVAVSNVTYWVGSYSGSGDGVTVTTEFNYINGTQKNITTVDSDDTTGDPALRNVNSPIPSMGLINVKVWALGTTVFPANHELINYTLFGSLNSTVTGNVSVSNTFDEAIIWNLRFCDLNNKCNFSSSNYTLYPDATIPQVAITYPTGSIDYQNIANVSDFNWTATDVNLDTCWYDYNNVNTTVTCGDNTTTFTVVENYYNATFYANDSFGNTNSSFMSWDYRTLELTRNFDAVVQVSESNVLSIELLDNASATNVTLDYNGASYPTTNTGNFYNATLTASATPGPYTFFWNITYAGVGQIVTESSLQTVVGVEFGLCNATLTQPFFFINFSDESDSSFINASIPTSTFVYYASNPNDNKSYSLTNLTTNMNYSFCATPADETFTLDYRIQYASGGYPQRVTHPAAISISNVTTNVTLKLLPTTTGQYVTVQVVNVAEQVLEGVTISVTRVIEGVTTEVSSGTTDSAGTITFFLDPNFVHTFTHTKSGYVTLIKAFAPTQTSYTTTLQASATSGVVDYSRGMIWGINPANQTLVNNTNYTFEFRINSTYYELEKYGFTVKDEDGATLYTDSGTSTSGETLSKSLNTALNKKITMDFYWFLNDTYTNDTKNWYVVASDGTGWSLLNAINNTRATLQGGLFGADDFAIAIISFLAVFLIVGITSWKFGIVSPAAISSMILILVATMDVGLGLFGAFKLAGAIPNVPTIIIGMITISLMFREMYR